MQCVFLGGSWGCEAQNLPLPSEFWLLAEGGLSESAELSWPCMLGRRVRGCGAARPPLPALQHLLCWGWPLREKLFWPRLTYLLSLCYFIVPASREGLKCNVWETRSEFIAQVSTVTEQYELPVTRQHILLLECVTQVSWLSSRKCIC